MISQGDGEKSWISGLRASGHWSAPHQKGKVWICARALAEAGCDLVMNARGADALETAAETIRADFGVDVVTVAADITTGTGAPRC